MAQARTSTLSAAWRRSRSADAAVLDLIEIRNCVRHVHIGLPSHCRVDLATAALQGAAAAGFEDAPTSFRSRTSGSTRPRTKCVRRTRCWMFMWGSDCTKRATCCTHARLSGGFRRTCHNTGYYSKTCWRMSASRSWCGRNLPALLPICWRRSVPLFERVGAQAPLSKWDILPDMDKVQALFFAFIRCPYLIAPVIQTWTAINGECVFSTLRGLFPAAPQDEADVEHAEPRR